MEIVVARYREDVAWTALLDAEVRITLYNKGGTPSPAPERAAWIDLENEGREAGTYRHHLIERYEDLDEQTAFVQGNPFDHCEGLYDRLRSVKDQPGFHWLSLRHERSDRNGWPAHGNLPVGAFYADLFEREGPEHFDFWAGACFVVHRDLIRGKPREFYRRIDDLCRGAYAKDGPWILERLWSYFFEEGS